MTAKNINNPEFFKTYTELSTYWGGFLAADGCVDKKGRIRLMLKYEDIGHLEKFKQHIGSEHKVGSNTTTYNRCSLEFTRRDMCKDLEENFNIVPNKTLVLEFPKNIPNNMIRHYIRGYFDGDGSICESFSNVNSITATIYASMCTGSKVFAYDIFNYINNTLQISGNVWEAVKDRKYNIKYTTNKAKILLDWLYAESNVYLDRKYALYDKIIANNIRLTR